MARIETPPPLLYKKAPDSHQKSGAFFCAGPQDFQTGRSPFKSNSLSVSKSKSCLPDFRYPGPRAGIRLKWVFYALFIPVFFFGANKNATNRCCNLPNFAVFWQKNSLPFQPHQQHIYLFYIVNIMLWRLTQPGRESLASLNILFLLGKNTF